ncbi:MAG TPA: hypothetical protein VGH93_06955, partial [Solirubrobacteraceae bacterium]
GVEVCLRWPARPPLNDDRWRPSRSLSGPALDRWRAAARLVATRWHALFEAEPESRSWAFASYVAALDDEEAAAAEIAALS